ncbi:hypothetical protein [Falsiroseomonas ponticola]|uniref:hypothetical protein n=1 Tax=Falsiroseomonas ponticola TaxID=2786951 RepID=UPI001934B520|nr:hypothetical protein [Roseomonas ponticola]
MAGQARLVERREPVIGWQALAPEWLALPGRSLAGLPDGARPPERRVALLHPGRGVALLDLSWTGAAPPSPREAMETVAALRHRLAVAGFPQVFSGHLPILHLVLEEAALPGLARRLEEAFAALPPLSLPRGDAWMGALQRALTTPAPAAPVEPPGHGGRWRMAGLGGLGVAGLGLGLAVMMPEGPVPRAAEASSTAMPQAAVLAGEAGSDGEAPAEGGAHLAAFDRALAALVASYGAESGARAEPVPEPEEARLPALAAETPRAEPMPEPDEAPLPELAAEALRVEPMPEPEEARLPDLAAEAPRAEPMPEPEEVRLPDLAAETPRAEAMPEPEEARLPDLAAETPRAEPMPEPEEARLPELAAEMPRAEPVPEPEEARLPALAAEAPRAEPAAAPRVAALDPRLVEALLARGQAMMAQGDISGARLLFGRAAQAGSAEGAAAMARSFDAAVLAALGARGIRPDAAQAAFWQQRAAELGAARRESP